MPRSSALGFALSFDMGFNVIDAAKVHDEGVGATVEAARRILGDRPVYLTFDIDCLDPGFAPGTGTPVVGGLTTRQAQQIVGGLGAIDFVGMDMVEVAPVYDHGEITALAAASLILDFLCMRSQNLPSRA